MIDVAALAVIGTVILAALYLWVIHALPLNDPGPSSEWLEANRDPIIDDWINSHGRGSGTAGARPEPDPRPPQEQL